MNSIEILYKQGSKDESLLIPGMIYAGIMGIGYKFDVIFLYTGKLGNITHFLNSDGSYTYGVCCTAVDIKEATLKEQEKLKKELRQRNLLPKEFDYEIY